MSMEDSAVNGSNLTVTRYGLGARGIDYEEVAEVRYGARTKQMLNLASPLSPAFPHQTSPSAFLQELRRPSACRDRQRSHIRLCPI